GERSKAQKALTEYLKSRDAQESRGTDYTFGELRRLYLDHSKATAKERTYVGHRKVLRLVAKFEHRGQAYADRPATESTTTDLERIVVAWHEAGRKATYIARMVASVQAVFNWSAEPAPNRTPERLIPTNPLRGYSSPHTKAAAAPDRHIDDAALRRFL